MSNKHENKDLISESDYTRRMSSLSSTPESDSPGDSESDAGKEFRMGLKFHPQAQDEENEEESDEDLEFIESESEFEEEPIITSELIENAKVVSSGQPAPWLDLKEPTDTH